MGARVFFIFSSLGVGIHRLLGGFEDVDHLFCFPLLFSRTWIIYYELVGFRGRGSFIPDITTTRFCPISARVNPEGRRKEAL